MESGRHTVYPYPPDLFVQGLTSTLALPYRGEDTRNVVEASQAPMPIDFVPGRGYAGPPSVPAARIPHGGDNTLLTETGQPPRDPS